MLTQDLDPYYTPSFWNGSLTSIHSVYEKLVVSDVKTTIPLSDTSDQLSHNDTNEDQVSISTVDQVSALVPPPVPIQDELHVQPQSGVSNTVEVQDCSSSNPSICIDIEDILEDNTSSISDANLPRTIRSHQNSDSERVDLTNSDYTTHITGGISKQSTAMHTLTGYIQEWKRNLPQAIGSGASTVTEELIPTHSHIIDSSRNSSQAIGSGTSTFMEDVIPTHSNTTDGAMNSSRAIRGGTSTVMEDGLKLTATHSHTTDGRYVTNYRQQEPLHSTLFARDAASNSDAITEGAKTRPRSISIVTCSSGYATESVTSTSDSYGRCESRGSNNFEYDSPLDDKPWLHCMAHSSSSAYESGLTNGDSEKNFRCRSHEQHTDPSSEDNENTTTCTVPMVELQEEELDSIKFTLNAKQQYDYENAIEDHFFEGIIFEPGP